MIEKNENNIKSFIENREVMNYIEKQSKAFGISENQYINNNMNNYINLMKAAKDELKDNNNSNKNMVEIFKQTNFNKKLDNEEINLYIGIQSKNFGISKGKYLTNCISNYINIMKEINKEQRKQELFYNKGKSTLAEIKQKSEERLKEAKGSEKIKSSKFKEIERRI